MILSFLNKKQDTLGKASLLLVFFTFLGQLLSIVRDRLLAGEFGAGVELDIYYTAFRIPDLLFVLVCSFFSIYILTSVILEKESGGKEEVRLFLNKVITFFSLLIVAFCFVIFLIYPYVVDIFFPEFIGENRERLIFITRVLLISPVLLGLSNIFASINQLNKKFYPFALSPVLYNLSNIFGILFFYPLFGLVGLAYGVVLGAFLHVFISYLPVKNDGFNFKIDFGLKKEDIKNIFKISLPRTAGLVSRQVVLFIIAVYAATLGHGYIALFMFSFVIYSVTLSLLGSTVSIASFSQSSKKFAVGDIKGFIEGVSNSFRYLSFWAIPVTVLFLLFNNEAVRIILGTGKFDVSSQYIVSLGIFIFAFSIFFQSLALFLSTSYFATQRTLKPFLINFGSDLFIVISAFCLKEIYLKNDIFRERVNDLFHVTGNEAGILLIIAAFSVGIIINGIVLFIFFSKDFKGFLGLSLEKYYKKTIPALLMLVFGFLSLNFLRNIFGENILDILIYSLVVFMVISIIFIFSSFLLKDKEFLVIKNNLKKKFFN